VSRPWFVAPAEDWAGDEVLLDPDESHHALAVLRLRAGDDAIITDGRGRVAQGVLAGPRGGRVALTITGEQAHTPARPQLAVYQGAAKGAKNDLVVERLGELGAHAAIIYSSERTVVRWDDAKVERNATRWAAIARVAAKQSRSPFVMQTDRLVAWQELEHRIAGEPYALVLWEEASRPLRNSLPADPDRVALVVGPEGGLAPEEAEVLESAGAELVSLGDRIIRTENAALVGAALISYHYGLIG
jgi:16S rRNA (uracil1498-N3)-methyltransferase